MRSQTFDQTNVAISNVTTKISDSWEHRGIIAIPKLGILLPIYNQPYNDKALMEGAQQLPTLSKQTDTLGQGNFILVGHNFDDGYSFFSPLQEHIHSTDDYIKGNQFSSNNWLTGQSIFIFNKDEVYEYVIKKQYIVAKDDLTVTTDSNQPIINLITCLEPNDNFRIITSGTLAKKWNWEKTPNKIKDYFDLDKNNYNFKR